jgi:DNA-3-methyladenine glycosylase I
MSFGHRQSIIMRTGKGISTSLLKTSILNVKYTTIEPEVKSGNVDFGNAISSHQSLLIECSVSHGMYNEDLTPSASDGHILWAAYATNSEIPALAKARERWETENGRRVYDILLIEVSSIESVREFAEFFNTVPILEQFSGVGYRTNTITGLNIAVNLPCNFLQITDIEQMGPENALLLQLSSQLGIQLFRPDHHDNVHDGEWSTWFQAVGESVSTKERILDPGQARCDWVTDPLLVYYHDYEWGFSPTYDNRWFEFVVLETFQAGLSWKTILNKRLGFRRAFHGFDIDQVARFNDGDVERLLADANIVRNRKKILASIENAQIMVRLRGEFGSLNVYFTKHVATLPDPLSHLMRTFRFVGKTTAESIAYATGLLEPPHDPHCYKHAGQKPD